jgi:hypothetical protein
LAESDFVSRLIVPVTIAVAFSLMRRYLPVPTAAELPRDLRLQSSIYDLPYTPHLISEDVVLESSESLSRAELSILGLPIQLGDVEWLQRGPFPP